MKLPVLFVAGAAVLAGCGSTRTSGPDTIYRARLFTADLRGAAGIPLDIRGPDGTHAAIRADDDGRFCLIVPDVSTEAGTVSPHIDADWTRIAQVRPAETTRFARDAIALRLSGVPGFMVAPDRITGSGRDRAPDLDGLPRSPDWRGGQDDAAQCHVIERGHDRLVDNPQLPGGAPPMTDRSYGPRDAVLLAAARDLARRAARRIDACFRRHRTYSACWHILPHTYRRIAGGFISGPMAVFHEDGYTIDVLSNAGTYRAERGYRGAPLHEDCRAVAVTSCPPGIAP